jgi:hypothetical protein
MKREASLSLTILYSDPHRRDEIGMTMIVEQAKAAAMMDHLEHRGFLIDKITVRCRPKRTANMAALCPAS